VDQFKGIRSGTPELILILAIVLLLLGGKKLPQLSRSLGQSMKELRKGITGDVNEKKRETPKKATPANKNKAA
jgi:sec-independent protein translocase protein TatA